MGKSLKLKKKTGFKKLSFGELLTVCTPIKKAVLKVKLGLLFDTQWCRLIQIEWFYAIISNALTSSKALLIVSR